MLDTLKQPTQCSWWKYWQQPKIWGDDWSFFNMGRYYRFRCHDVMDGFDLGIGIMFPFIKKNVMWWWIPSPLSGMVTKRTRRCWSICSISTGLFNSALYLPIIFMVIALIFRGVNSVLKLIAPNICGTWLLFSVNQLPSRDYFGCLYSRTENGIYAGGSLDWLSLFTQVLV